ncbi:hypothetical protein T12_17107 [Trichinella patagoniensis]|uniref:Uncharacterized protein n=1 Tax=Trichinella patagoniensis TaxID=990121 RepID=A0A0V0ZBS9_9BILA|nr:hypothetical protein T12_17107 [Trichinella patagoniensis]
MHFSQSDKMYSDDQSSIVSMFCYTSTAAVILFVECVLMEMFISAQCSDVSFKKLTISVDQIERHMWILLKKDELNYVNASIEFDYVEGIRNLSTYPFVHKYKTG